jgi:RecA/RadA recombinase
MGTHLTSQSQSQATPTTPASQTHNNNFHDTIGAFKSGSRVLSNLTIHKPSSTEELLAALDGLEEEILKRNQLVVQSTSRRSPTTGHDSSAPGNSPYHNTVMEGQYPVRLVIVDSIAAPMRRDFGADFAPQRAAAVFQCAQALKRLADQLHLAVVVINQVSTTSNSSESVGDTGTSSSTAAALGTSWHHCVSTRLLLDSTIVKKKVEHQPHEIEENRENFATSGMKQLHEQELRRMCVVKSNLTEFRETNFEVSTLGIVECCTKNGDQRN